jgi:hypothetical protein
MSKNSDSFISEIFWTTDEMFSFQKVGRYYRLYDRNSGYAFLKEFTSFQAMQDFMNKARADHAKKENRAV